MSKSDFSGYWRITHTGVWDQEAMDLVAPAHLSFSDRRGSLSMIAIEASLDCRYEGKRVDFSLFGADEYDPIAGRPSWARKRPRHHASAGQGHDRGDEPGQAHHLRR